MEGVREEGREGGFTRTLVQAAEMRVFLPQQFHARNRRMRVRTTCKRTRQGAHMMKIKEQNTEHVFSLQTSDSHFIERIEKA